MEDAVCLYCNGKGTEPVWFGQGYSDFDLIPCAGCSGTGTLIAERPVLLPGGLVAHAEDGTDITPARSTEVDGLDDEVVDGLLEVPPGFHGLGQAVQVLAIGHASRIPDASRTPDGSLPLLPGSWKSLVEQGQDEHSDGEAST